jgi:hypothetical protein
MPVLTKNKHRDIIFELQQRYNNLLSSIASRELRNSGEGLKGKFKYTNPEEMCAAIGDSSDVRMAVNDFKQS